MEKDLQSKIISKLNVKPKISSEKEIRRIIDFLKIYLKRYPVLLSFILGISGGQDSTLAGKLTQMAIKEIRKETKNESYKFIAVHLPYGRQADQEDVEKALSFINPDILLRINIKKSVDIQIKTLEDSGIFVSDLNKGNIKARQRMLIQYSIAKHFSGSVIGTDHAAENITGFFTKFGDGGADILPLFPLNKRQGKQILKFLRGPEYLYKKNPTADLEDKRPLVSDEEVLGVTYQEIDDYLEGKIVRNSAKTIIENYWFQNEHKRHLPVSIFDDFWK